MRSMARLIRTLRKDALDGGSQDVVEVRDLAVAEWRQSS
jgi:hypothetical protein